MTRRLRWIAGPLFGAGLLLAACAPPAVTVPVATNRVDLPPSYKFEPALITVPDGTTVTWTNKDNFTHSSCIHPRVQSEPGGVAFAWKVTPGAQGGRSPYNRNTDRPETVVASGGRGCAAGSVVRSIRAERAEGRRDGAPWGFSTAAAPVPQERGGAQLPRHVGCRQHLAWTHKSPEAHCSVSRAECLLTTVARIPGHT